MSDDQNEEVLRSALGALSPVIQRAVAASRQRADRQQRAEHRNRTREIEADESVEQSAEEEESGREEEEKSDGVRDMEAEIQSIHLTLRREAKKSEDMLAEMRRQLERQEQELRRRDDLEHMMRETQEQQRQLVAHFLSQPGATAAPAVSQVLISHHWVESKTTAEAWVAEYTAVADAQQLTTSQMIARFGLGMTKSKKGANWYRDYMEAHQQDLVTWRQFTEDFITTMQGHGYEATKKSELLALAQEPEETMDEYYWRTKELVRMQSSANRAHYGQEKVLTELWINGLWQEAKVALSVMGHERLDDAKRSAVKWEAATAAERKKLKDDLKQAKANSKARNAQVAALGEADQTMGAPPLPPPATAPFGQQQRFPPQQHSYPAMEQQYPPAYQAHGRMPYQFQGRPSPQYHQQPYHAALVPGLDGELHANQTCHGCNLAGHVARNCPYSERRSRGNGGREVPTCYNCGVTGHISTYCPAKLQRDKEMAERRQSQDARKRNEETGPVETQQD